MLIGFKVKEEGERKVGNIPFWIVGFVIGVKSGLTGLGGGVLSIPFFTFLGLKKDQVVGTTTLITLTVALTGSICLNFVYPNHVPMHNVIGNIYWPAVVGLAPFTIIGVTFGVKLNSKTSSVLSRKIFAAVLMLIAIKIFF